MTSTALPQRTPWPYASAQTTVMRVITPTPPVGWFDVDPLAEDYLGEVEAASGWFEPALPAVPNLGSPAVPPCDLLAEAVDVLRANGRHVVAEWVEGWARARAPMPTPEDGRG